MMNIAQQIARELSISLEQVDATLRLFGEKATVPFIARYRKDVTGNLDEVQLRSIEERHAYLTELEKRKQAILESIESQGKLSEELKAQIESCPTKTALEDLYLPYRPKRRTRAMIAREKGLEPLADLLWEQALNGPAPEVLARAYLSEERGVADVEAALEGARDILAERVAEDAVLRAGVRQTTLGQGQVVTKVTAEWEGKPSKFDMYYTFSESARTIPSHRYLAIERGVQEGVLQSSLEVPEDLLLGQLERATIRNSASPYVSQVREATHDAYHRLMAPSIETDVRSELKERADTEALLVFQANLKALLLASPLGQKVVLGMDPGYRTGCKVAVVDGTGKFLASDVLYLTQGEGGQRKAEESLLKLLRSHRVDAIAIGNGTGSRETDAFVRGVLSRHPEVRVVSVVVSEAGASVYSASPLGTEEFPSLDVTIRGAISIARRLQDPLAELVKIDPKAIGVGQYQHDVDQKRLKKGLDDVVESAVNYVGVELNTASAPLLRFVAGIGESLARNIVNFREANGPFADRQSLMKVPRFGPKAFEQAAGFLRIRHGKNPLDDSAVHPESYSLVERMALDGGIPVAALLRNITVLEKLPLQRYREQGVGELTLKDIVAELKKPGRDPRNQFEAPVFDPGITELEHVKEGQLLEGVVTNVTDFGCFVDIGVHQDGLVHISRISETYITDPKTVVSVGMKVKVRVLSVDLTRKRISLTMKPSELKGPLEPGRSGPASQRDESRGDRRDGGPGPKFSGTRQGATKSGGAKPSEPFNPAFAGLAKLVKR